MMPRPDRRGLAALRAERFVRALQNLSAVRWLEAAERATLDRGRPERATLYRAADQAMLGLLDHYHSALHMDIAGAAAEAATQVAWLLDKQARGPEPTLAVERFAVGRSVQAIREQLAALAIGATYATLTYDELGADQFDVLYHPFALAIPIETLDS